MSRRREKLIWMDNNNNVVPEDKATQVHVQELNRKGEVIIESWVELDPL